MEKTHQKRNWVELNSQWESSGLPQKQFLKARDISYTLFVYERGKLTEKRKKSLKPVFFVARVVPPLILELRKNLVLRLPTGIKLDIPPGGDLAQVGRLLLCRKRGADLLNLRPKLITPGYPMIRFKEGISKKRSF